MRQSVFSLRTARFLVVLVVLMFFVVFVFCWPGLSRMIDNDPFNDWSFKRATWLSYSGSDEQENARGKMAEDLIGRYLHTGLPRESIIELLGRPDGIRKPDEIGGARGLKRLHEVFVYRLGMWSFGRWDHDYLRIGLDRSGRLVAAWIAHT